MTTCDNCSQVAEWHVFMYRMGTYDAPSDARPRELKLCNRCWDYVAPVVELFGWTVSSVYFLEESSG